MCAFKTLHYGDDGYVVRCRQCDHIHIGFGTTVLALTYDQFLDFDRTVDEYYELHADDAQRHRKTIQIPTAARAVTLVYSPADLKKLARMLTKAKDRLAIEKLFVFHDN